MKYAEVDFWLGSYAATVKAFDAMAASTVQEGPGLSHDETVQVVSCFAVWRDYCAYGGTQEFAFFRNGEFYYAADSITAAEYKLIMDGQLKEGSSTSIDSAGKKTTMNALSVWGEGPKGYSAEFSPGEGLPPSWGGQLGAACDWSLGTIEKAKQAASKPVAGGELVNVLLPAAAVTVAIIVAGAAATVIGAVAAWRLFDPHERTSLAAVAGASNAYMARIDTFKKTGKMPPPSQIELGARMAVEETAAKSNNDAWMMFGLATGGIVVGTAAGSFINYQMRGAA